MPLFSDRLKQLIEAATNGSYVTYILKCADGSLYTGWTNDIEKRLLAHNSGNGAKYTRARLPVTLLASWNFKSKSEAMSMEYEIKKMARLQKLNLAAFAAEKNSEVNSSAKTI